MSFQKDYFLSTDYTVDCKTGLITPTGSAPVIPSALQTKTQLLKGESPRYDFTNGNIIDTERNNAKVGTLPSACSNYDFDDDIVWGPPHSSDTRGSSYNYNDSDSPFLDSQMTDAQRADWLNSIYNSNSFTSTAGGSTTLSSDVKKLTGISPNTGGNKNDDEDDEKKEKEKKEKEKKEKEKKEKEKKEKEEKEELDDSTTKGAGAGSGSGTSLNYVANAGLKPSLSTCKQYYNVGWN